MTVQVDTRRLNRILRNLPGNTSAAVRSVAFAIEGIAKTKTAFDTGALRASIYTHTGTHDGYAKASAEAHAKAADRNKTIETTPLPAPKDDTTAHVGPSVEYAIYQEFGTTLMAAHPFLGPAVNQVARNLEDHFRGVVTDE